MISLPSGTRIWLVAGVTDMRKSFNGLGEQVQHVLNDNRKRKANAVCNTCSLQTKLELLLN